MMFQILYLIFVNNNNVDATSEYFPGTDYLLERIVLRWALSQWSFLANHYFPRNAISLNHY